MRIRKYIIRRSKTIKHILKNRDQGTPEDVSRMLQVYNCRFFGICFYRDEKTFISERKQFNLK
jgi:hypothetical protein